MPKFGSTLPDMTSVMKDSPHKSVLLDLLTKSRLRATQVIREEIPKKILHIQNLLDQENDPSSLMWLGHIEHGDYVRPRMLQPGQPMPIEANGSTTRSNGNTNGDAAHDSIPEEKRSLAGGVKQATVNGIQVTMPGQVTRASKAVEADGANDEAERTGTVGDNGEVEQGVRVGPHWFEVVPQNTVHMDLMKLTLKEHEELHMLCMDLKMWLEMEVPVIEDGNSFGAEVQEHLLRDIDQIWKRSNSWQNGMRQHHADRIKQAVDWVKFPNVMDFPAAIASSDRFDNFLVRSYLRSVLISYSSLLTKLERNWAKVINPKGNSSSGEAMY